MFCFILFMPSPFEILWQRIEAKIRRLESIRYNKRSQHSYTYPDQRKRNMIDRYLYMEKICIKILSSLLEKAEVAHFRPKGPISFSPLNPYNNIDKAGTPLRRSARTCPSCPPKSRFSGSIQCVGSFLETTQTCLTQFFSFSSSIYHGKRCLSHFCGR